MSIDLETERRITRLEAEAEDRDRVMKEMKEKVDKMYDVLMQAKGARWAIITAAGLAGAVTGFATKFLPWTATFPK